MDSKIVFCEGLVVCIPVYNEEKYIRSTLECLRAQSYTDFKVLIADNASSDQTASICQEYAKIDDRFFYFKQKTNIGASRNIDFLCAKTSSKYVMFLGAHDLLAPHYFEKQIAVMEGDSNISLSYSCVQWIDESGDKIKVTDGGAFLRGDSCGLTRYLKTVAGPWGECTAFNGVIRRSCLLGSKFLQIVGPDHLILTRLQFFGSFNRIEEPIYFRREFLKRNESCIERISGVAATNSKNKFVEPSYKKLCYAQIRDYFRLPISALKKMRYFLCLMLSLDYGYNFFRGYLVKMHAAIRHIMM